MLPVRIAQHLGQVLFQNDFELHSLISVVLFKSNAAYESIKSQVESVVVVY